MDPHILYLDLDDTLLNSEKRVSPENAAAVRGALRAGHQVVLTTGRPLAATLPLAEELGLLRPDCFVISFNGALIYDCGAGKPLVMETLPLALTRELWNLAKARGIHCQGYSRSDTLVCADDEEVRFYAGRIHVTYRVDASLPDSLREETVKLLFIDLKDHAKLEAFRDEAAARCGGALSLFFSNRWFLECVRAGVSKGDAVRRLAALLGVPIERTIAVGDQENDLPMIRAAGIGCAMANATDALKAEADYVTERDADHSGVAEIIKKFLPG